MIIIACIGNESKIIFGINNLHSRFAHTSIIQYLSAINNNFLFLENGITIPLASLVSFFYIYFFNDVLRVITKRDGLTYAKYLSLFIIIYISYKINRYSGFGNDAIGHLTLFYMASYILKSEIEKINLKKLLLLSVFIFLNKPMLGIIFLIPFLMYVKKKDYRLKKIKSIFFSFPTLFLCLWILKNIIISGCMVYPLKETCLYKLPWTNENQVIRDGISGSAWSKGWPDRIDKNIKMSEYNKDFNWLRSWLKIHFKHSLKTIAPFIIVLFSIIFWLKINNQKSKETNDEDYSSKNYILLITCFIGILSFFLIFPLYRYGYSYLVLFFSLIAINLIQKELGFKKNIKVFKLFFIICIIGICLKQFNRIYQNSNTKDIWPNIYAFKEKNKKFKKIVINENFNYYLAYEKDSLCMYSSSPCTSYRYNGEIYPKKKLGYTILNLSND